MPSKIFFDTSAWIAYSLKGEAHHKELIGCVASLIDEKATFFTSNDVIDETVTRLITATNLRTTNTFIDLFEKSLKEKQLVQLWTDEQIQSEAIALLRKYSDHRLSLTDATTVVFVKRFNIDTVLTLDSDFVKVGLDVFPLPRKVK